jgi:hypothetical protein
MISHRLFIFLFEFERAPPFMGLKDFHDISIKFQIILPVYEKAFTISNPNYLLLCSFPAGQASHT